MLQILREKKSGLFVKIVLGIVVLVFSFFGIESYFITRTSTDVAMVGKTPISQDKFRERFGEYRQRVTQMMGDRVDGEYFQKPETKRQVLDQLVNEQVLLNANVNLGMTVPAESVRDEIANIPAFQEDGKFDVGRYRTILAGQGMSPRGFEQRVRQDLAVRELPTAVAASAVVTSADVDTYLRLRSETRDFSYIKLDKPDDVDATVPDEEIADYYKTHADEFMTAEEVSLEYLELDAMKIHVPVTPDDATLQARYEKEKARFMSPEQRLVSHILVKVPGKGSPSDQKEALAKAEAIEKRIADGADFAEVAKEESDDLGSKIQGGDLGWLEKGMTDPAFDDALFAMKKGEISDPVLSSEGYHIIDLRDIREGKTRSFAEVKPELIKDFTETEHDRLFSDQAGRLTDLTYQDPSSLQPAAKELGLELHKTGLFSRQGSTGIAANPDVIKAAFSDNVMTQGNNSDPITLGPSHVVVVRLAERKPAKAKPLAEVSDTIKTDIIAERTSKQAKARADEWFANLQKTHDLGALAAAHDKETASETGVGRNSLNVDSALVKAVFEMPRPGDNPSEELVPLADDSYALIQLDKVNQSDPSTLDEKTREAARSTLEQARGALLAREFVEALRKGYKVQLFEDRLP